MQPVDNANISYAAAIAVNRFGIGARPGDLEAATADPLGWVMEKLQEFEFYKFSSPTS